MFGRLAIVALAVGLAGCAGLEPAGRNAQRARSSPTATAPTPPPAPRATLPPPQTHSAPTPAPAAAPNLTAPPPIRESAPVTASPPPMRQSAPLTPAAPPARTTPPVVAPQVTAPPSREPAPTAPRVRSDDDDIIVPGQVQTQVPPPAGDPRSNEERRADVRSWDRCVTQVQGAFDSDPMSPQLTTPEEYCRQSLGMSDRTAVPVARQQRRR